MKMRRAHPHAPGVIVVGVTLSCCRKRGYALRRNSAARTRARPDPSIAQAASDCQSNDANQRLQGCTAIINAKGKGYRVALPDAYDGRCRSYNELGQYQRAVDDCKAAIAINSRHPYAYNNLGGALLGLGDPKGAITAYSTSFELKPDFIYSYFGRARGFTQIENKESAKRDYQQILRLDPGNQAAKVELAALRIETDAIKEARVFLDDGQACLAKQTPTPTSTPSSIPQIATAAAELQLAITQFDEAGVIDAQKRLKDLVTQIPGFSECLEHQVAIRDDIEAKKLAAARKDGAKNIYFIDTSRVTSSLFFEAFVIRRWSATHRSVRPSSSSSCAWE
jgi:tetratricopeptide (TPR) repeat protein